MVNWVDADVMNAWIVFNEGQFWPHIDIETREMLRNDTRHIFLCSPRGWDETDTFLFWSEYEELFQRTAADIMSCGRWGPEMIGMPIRVAFYDYDYDDFITKREVMAIGHASMDEWLSREALLDQVMSEKGATRVAPSVRGCIPI